MAQSVARILGSSALTFETIAFCGALGMGGVDNCRADVAGASAANRLMAISRVIDETVWLRLSEVGF
jgi:hypothetical protein